MAQDIASGPRRAGSGPGWENHYAAWVLGAINHPPGTRGLLVDVLYVSSESYRTASRSLVSAPEGVFVSPLAPSRPVSRSKSAIGARI